MGKPMRLVKRNQIVVSAGLHPNSPIRAHKKCRRPTSLHNITIHLAFEKRLFGDSSPFPSADFKSGKLLVLKTERG
jgi:hypothetical protein